jgi:hypothetical protein
MHCISSIYFFRFSLSSIILISITPVMTNLENDNRSLKEPNNLPKVNVNNKTSAEAPKTLPDHEIEQNPENEFSSFKMPNYFKIVEFPFRETILSIWEKNGKKIHPKVNKVEVVDEIKPQKIDEPRKPDFPFNPYENFF